MWKGEKKSIVATTECVMNCISFKRDTCPTERLMALLNDQRTHLVLTALAAALATYSILSISRTNRRVDLASGITSSRVQPSPSSLLPQLPPAPEYTEQLVREQLARNYAFLGEEGVARVRRASVVVVGCGGVGSWVAVMLARSGVAQLRLIDFDYVTLSSLNRHATAALADVGTPKVQCVARALRAIAPFVQVDPRVELWRGGPEGADLLQGADWVIGAWCGLAALFILTPHFPSVTDDGHLTHRRDRQYWYQGRVARPLRATQHQGVFLHGRRHKVGPDTHPNRRSLSDAL